MEGTLDEEKEIDQELTQLAEGINVEAIGGQNNNNDKLKPRLAGRGSVKAARA